MISFKTTLIYFLNHLFLSLTSTIALSTFMYIVLLLKVYREIGDAGYKLNGRLGKFVMHGYVKGKLVPMREILLCPFYNLFVMLVNTFNYNQFKNNIMKSLDEALVPLNEDEKEIYKKHHNGLTIFLLTKKYALNFHPLVINISKNGEYSTIKCILIKGSIIILQVKGPMKKLSKEKMEETILDYLTDLDLMYKQETGNDESFLDDISKYSEYTFDTSKFNAYKPEDINTCEIDNGEIIWAYTEDKKDIEILTSFGEARKLKVLEQKKIILEHLKKEQTEMTYVPEVKDEARVRKTKY